MQTSALLKRLGYASSANCLQGNELEQAPDFGHVFRRATEKAGLEAVYCLRQPAAVRRAEVTRSLVPVTYVCRANSLEDADRIHRLVWNQSVVPFVIVLAQDGVRLYSGFEHTSDDGVSGQSAYLAEATLADAADKLRTLSAESIDSGEVWDEWGARVRPDRRVEWRLLADLRKLEHQMSSAGLRDRPLIHSLIGKYVYLHYLRGRNILSDDRLGKWGLSWSQISGRSAQIRSFTHVCNKLDEWLNGSIFPLLVREIDEIGEQVLRRVAGVFAGDDPRGQLHLDFAAYDFSHIPIETLSVIYEQFLHATPIESGGTAGKQQAAYYTPLPVVNFIIDRMEELHPLRPPMRVLDFSCGSGTFLVQCYRKLIEDRICSCSKTAVPRPPELRQLLIDHIFGMDVDGEACRVAELALTLTLLDYVEPPDLTNTNFKLPCLADRNIVRTNAFDDLHPFVVKAKKDGFDWIVGNPPWKDLKKDTTDPIHKPVLDWMLAHKTDNPTGGNQTAEAFAWRSLDFSRDGALAGLLIPAMTLFKKESRAFRQHFFSSNEPTYVANFANLAEILFAGRSRVPAAAVIFRPAQESQLPNRIPVFSPLVANQEPTRPRGVGRRHESWSIVVGEGEIRAIDLREIQLGDALTWKLAAWGSHLDKAIFQRTKRLPNLATLIDEASLVLSEGLQLREKSADKKADPLEHHPVLEGKRTLITTKLDRLEHSFVFPDNAIGTVEKDRTYVRKGRFKLPESVCRPPHVLVSETRNWAIYEDDYLIVPPRQIGIAGERSKDGLLKALALYLNSEFVQYHQFFVSISVGVQRLRGDLAALRQLPVPTNLERKEVLRDAGSIYDRLAKLDREAGGAIDADMHEGDKADLLRELNAFVNAALGLRRLETIRVSDVVGVLLGLRDGKVEARAVDAPTDSQLQRYSRTLKKELDAFVDDGVETSHAIDVWNDGRQGVIQIDFGRRNGGVEVHPRSKSIPVMQQSTEIREHLESKSAQWRYFNRNLRLFAEDRFYLFKPMQRFHWLESQAVLDAGEVIAQVLDEARTS